MKKYVKKPQKYSQTSPKTVNILKKTLAFSLTHDKFFCIKCKKIARDAKKLQGVFMTEKFLEAPESAEQKKAGNARAKIVKKTQKFTAEMIMSEITITIDIPDFHQGGKI